MCGITEPYCEPVEGMPSSGLRESRTGDSSPMVSMGSLAVSMMMIDCTLRLINKILDALPNFANYAAVG